MLNSIISKKEEQIKELDNLAQATFHEMFGDPIENEKGWEAHNFSMLFNLKSGKTLTVKEQTTGKYNVYGGNGINGTHTSYNMDGKHIIIGRVGAYCGNVRFINEKFWLTDNAFSLQQIGKFYEEHFLCFLLRNLKLGHYAKRTAQPVISNISLKNISVPIPPLPLQQSFAAKVTEIENMKANITRSITDTRQLLDATMDKYFG